MVLEALAPGWFNEQFKTIQPLHRYQSSYNLWLLHEFNIEPENFIGLFQFCLMGLRGFMKTNFLCIRVSCYSKCPALNAYSDLTYNLHFTQTQASSGQPNELLGSNKNCCSFMKGYFSSSVRQKEVVKRIVRVCMWLLAEGYVGYIGSCICVW